MAQKKAKKVKKIVKRAAKTPEPEVTVSVSEAPAPKPQPPQIGRPNDWRTRKYDALARKGLIVVGDAGFWVKADTGEDFVLP